MALKKDDSNTDSENIAGPLISFMCRSNNAHYGDIKNNKKSKRENKIISNIHKYIHFFDSAFFLLALTMAVFLSIKTRSSFFESTLIFAFFVGIHQLVIGLIAGIQILSIMGYSLVLASLAYFFGNVIF